eukprot:497830_1
MASSANNSNSNSNNTNNSIHMEQNVHMHGPFGVKRNRNINANMNGKSPPQQQQQPKNIYNGIPPQGKVFNDLKHQDLNRLQSLGYTIHQTNGRRDSYMVIPPQPHAQPQHMYQFPPPPTCTVQQHIPPYQHGNSNMIMSLPRKKPRYSHPNNNLNINQMHTEMRNCANKMNELNQQSIDNYAMLHNELNKQKQDIKEMRDKYNESRKMLQVKENKINKLQ